MTFLVLIVGLALGIFIGRVYGWMKYRYPESREMILVLVERRRQERLQLQLENDKIKTEINKRLEQRMSG